MSKELNGKVVFKFRCYEMEEWDICHEDLEDTLFFSCLSIKEFADYSKGQVVYAINISDLEIFDKPKEFSEFYPYCKDKKCEYRNNHCIICYRTPLTKAPQSFAYIEVE